MLIFRGGQVDIVSQTHTEIFDDWLFRGGQVDILSQTHTDVFDDSIDSLDVVFSRRSGRHFVTDSYRHLWRLIDSLDVDFSRRSGRHLQRSLTDWLTVRMLIFRGGQVDNMSQTHTEIFDDWLSVRMLIFRGGEIDILSQTHTEIFGDWLSVRMLIFRGSKVDNLSLTQRSLTTDWQLGCWLFAAVRSAFCHRLSRHTDLLLLTDSQDVDFSRRSGRLFVTDSYRDLWRLTDS